MRVLGFEPRYALSNDGLNVARLTAPAHPHDYSQQILFLKVFLCEINPDNFQSRFLSSRALQED